MSSNRWSWLLNDRPLEEPAVEVDDLIPALASSVSGEGGYPALFSLGDGVGFFATGPGQGLLYYFDQQKDIAFLFPNSAD